FNYNSLGTLATGSYVAFGTDRWGELYAADAVGGRIMRFAGTTCNPVAAINGGLFDTVEVCGTADAQLFTPKGQGFSYDWSIDGLPYLHPYDTLTINTAGANAEIVLTVTDQNGCSATDSITIISHPLPVVSFSLDSIYCDFDAPEILLPVPPGGVFTGSGVVGTTFDPAAADSGLNVITYTYTDAFGCTSSLSKSTYVDYCTGIAESELLASVRVFPNPNQGEFKVSLPVDRTRSLRISVTDPLGRMVYSEQFIAEAGNAVVSVSLPEAPVGIYLLRVGLDDTTSRVMKVTFSR
ncbi:MAG: T9SS type A sorting domain-containing protein, partial [Bacteroidota bacterium]